MTTFVNDDAYPFLTVAYIETRFGSNWFSGSGVLVGRNDVLTASHVVYDVNYGLADEINIYLSYDPNETNVPYKSVYVSYYANFDPNGDGLISFGDGKPGNSLGGSELDVALLSLSSAVGDIYGWMGMDFSFSSGYANVTGHPGRYDDFMTNDYGNVWKDGVDQTIHISNLEINPGNSGGPIWYDNGSGPYVVGVVSTASGAASLSGHAHWLKDAIVDNDKFITDGGSSGSVKYGTDGNDVFAADTSITSYVGRAGTDTIKFTGTRSQYKIIVDSDGNGTVEQTSTHSAWALSGIERLDFQNGTLAFDIAGNAGQAYRLYQAAFDRVPDAEGLSYWIGRLDSGTTTLNAVADSFIHSPEFVRTYGTPDTVSNSKFVELLYLHTLGREYDQSGFNYWVDKLDTHQTNRGDLLAEFSNSNENHLHTADATANGIWFV